MKGKRVILLALIICFILFINGNISEFKCSCFQFRKIYLKSPPLKGDDIWELQRELKILGFYKGKLNSTYDRKTYLAVKRFQQSNKLVNDGIVTNEVWSNLGMKIHKGRVRTVNEKLSPQGKISILVDTYKRKLIVYSNGKEYTKFPIAIGKSTKRTPVGEFKIIEKVDMWDKGTFGDKWMRLNVPWGNYGIHGTNKPGSIGYAVSNGCIRMFNRDVKKLYSWVKVGTKVKIIGYRKPIEITHIFKPGDKGKDVLLFEEKLKEFGFNPGYADGIFNNQTKRAMKEFKYIYGLKDDVIADQNTFHILNIK